jgi:TonB family protein
MKPQREILFRRALLAVVFLAVGFLYMPETVSAQDAVYQMAELTEQPKIADARQARNAILRSYNSRLQDAGVEGRVEVSFVVNTDGSVDEASVQVVNSPAEGLSQAAQVAVKRLKFAARTEGRPGRAVSGHDAHSVFRGDLKSGIFGRGIWADPVRGFPLAPNGVRGCSLLWVSFQRDPDLWVPSLRVRPEGFADNRSRFG